MVCRRFLSRSFSSRSSHAMWASMLGPTTTVVAVLRRFFSETSIVVSWYLRSYQRVENLRLGVSQRAHRRSDRFGKMGQDRCIQGIGLGQLTSGPASVAHLSWVDDHHRQLLGRQSCHKGQFQAARRLH